MKKRVRLLTESHAAKLAGVSTRTLENWISRGAVNTHVINGVTYVVAESLWRDGGGEKIDCSSRRSYSLSRSMKLTGYSRRFFCDCMNNGRVEFVLSAGGTPRIFLDSLMGIPRKVRTKGGSQSSEKQSTGVGEKGEG